MYTFKKKETFIFQVKSFDAHSTLVQVVDGNEMRVTGISQLYQPS